MTIAWFIALFAGWTAWVLALSYLSRSAFQFIATTTDVTVLGASAVPAVVLLGLGGYLGMRLVYALGPPDLAWLPPILSTAAVLAVELAQTLYSIWSRTAQLEPGSVAWGSAVVLVYFSAAASGILMGARRAHRRRPLPNRDAGGFDRGAGSAVIGGQDMPSIGAAPMITVDGIAEQESGVTPPPPPISLTALAIGFAVMFLIGVAIVVALALGGVPT